MKHATAERTSTLIRRLLLEDGPPMTTVGEIVDAFGHRAFGLVLLVASIPNCLPGLPGVNSVFGLPMLFFSVQIMLRHEHPWLPRFLRRKTVARAALKRIAERTLPMVERLERLIRPRLAAVTDHPGERAVGLMLSVFALSVILPLPGTNLVPSLGSAVVALGIAERDGGAVLAGIVIGIVGLAITVAIVAGLTLAFLALF